MNLDFGIQRLNRCRIPLLLAGLLAVTGGAPRMPGAVAAETAPAPPSGVIPGADPPGPLDPGTPGGSLFTGFS